MFNIFKKKAATTESLPAVQKVNFSEQTRLIAVFNPKYQPAPQADAFEYFWQTPQGIFKALPQNLYSVSFQEHEYNRVISLDSCFIHHGTAYRFCRIKDKLCLKKVILFLTSEKAVLSLFPPLPELSCCTVSFGETVFNNSISQHWKLSWLDDNLEHQNLLVPFCSSYTCFGKEVEQIPFYRFCSHGIIWYLEQSSDNKLFLKWKEPTLESISVDINRTVNNIITDLGLPPLAQPMVHYSPLMFLLLRKCLLSYCQEIPENSSDLRWQKNLARHLFRGFESYCYL